MPARNTRKQDPFARINNWDDGFQYIRNLPPSPPDQPNYYEAPRSRRPPWDSPSDPYAREPRRPEPRAARYPSPPSSSSGRRRHRRHASPPPPYRSTRSPSPPPARPRPRRDEFPLHRSKSAREVPHRFSRSPSPPRRPRRDEFPLPRSKTTRETSRRFSPSPSPSPVRRRRRSPSPLPSRHRDYSPRRTKGSGMGAGPAPGQTKAGGGRFAGLSPRWQQAATAAFQAGSMAALNMRSQPGGWGGEKGARVATAALGAAAMGALKGGKDKDRGYQGGGAKKSKGGGVEALGGMLGGFLVDQLAKGNKKGKRY